jgi:hypothetical protein
MSVCPKPHPLTVSKEIDGYLVLSRMGSEEFVVCKRVGARVFSLADGNRSVGGIIRLIADEFQLPFGEARQEVADSIQEMMIHRLLIVEDIIEPSAL